MIPLRTFLSAHAGRAREAFLREVREPHLLLRQRLTAGSAELPPLNEAAPTARITPDADAVGPGNPMLLPVRKVAGANEFANMVTLGRAPGNDIVIPDARVSRLQAFFRHDRGWWALGDVCSTNGTVVDGKRVSKEQVATFASWETFNYIAERQEGTIAINAGFEA